MSGGVAGVRTVTPLSSEHTYTLPLEQFLLPKHLPRTGPYLTKLSSVRMMVVVMLGAGAAGAGAVIGMSPAKAEIQRTHVKAQAIIKRFIWDSP